MSAKKTDLEAWRLVQSKLSKLFVHDMKNPLSALSANLSFLDSVLADESEEVRGAVGDSLVAVEMLLRFAENLNAIAAIEAGEPGEESPVRLPDLLASSAERNRDIAESAGVRVALSEPTCAGAIACWRQGAELAVENLLLSAIRHSPIGGEVTVSCREQNGQVVIEIRDQGKPVAEERRAGLLSREAQAEAKRDPGSRYGRGLGLYAAGLAAEALGGRISIDVVEGATRFALSIPSRRAE